MSLPSFHVFLGAEFVRMEGGEAEATIDLADHHRNRRGVVHGGVLSALLDSVMGAAVISSIPKEWWCATTSLSVQFLEGSREGRLRCTGRVLRKGRRVVFAGGEVHDEAGCLVAVAQGSWHLWPYRPGTKTAAPEPYVVVRESGERIRVGKILAVGRNYREHVREMGNPDAAPPVLFLKPATALVQDGGVVHIPGGRGEVHHEVEMVAVIGRGGRAIPEAEALEHVLGFAVGLDMTLRDVQAEAKRSGTPWTIAKGFDTSAPVSLVAPRDAVGDGSGLTLALEVNGQRRQEVDTSTMLLSVPALVAYASRLMTLEPGDLLFTGTPAGVGPVAPGDRLVATLERVGTLRVRVERSATEDEP